MFSLIIALTLFLLGFVAGFGVHKRLSIHYKARWLELVGQLNDKVLDSGEADTPTPRQVQRGGPGSTLIQAGGNVVTRPYVAGKWTLEIRYNGNQAEFFAIRHGYDDMPLGRTKNYQKFTALFRNDRDNAQIVVDQMNGGK